MKLWKKNHKLNKAIEQFTVGNDYLLDQKLLKYDCLASIAHAKMLNKIGLLSEEELSQLIECLNEIIDLHSKRKFIIKLEDEDSHTAIENFLVSKCGDVGKKIHTCRSRNDQVLTAVRLYEKEELIEVGKLLLDYKEALNKLIAKCGEVKIPGYTHMQKAMPTTVKIWLGSFICSIEDNLKLLDSVNELINQSPLGTAAGFGVPIFAIDQKIAAELLGFSKVIENPLYAQMSRGKFEAIIVSLLAQIMFDLNKLATDLMLFSMQEFSFVSFPEEFCTGSSIMPQKKNLDVLELIRAEYHLVIGEEFKVKSLLGNLMSGYNRDVQLTKEPLFNSFELTSSCLQVMSFILGGMKINKDKCEAALTKEIYATEEAYKLVKNGVPFREAYQEVAKKLAV